MGVNAQALLKQAQKTLLDRGVPNAAQDALALFTAGTGLVRLDLIKEPKVTVTADMVGVFLGYITRRGNGEPVARILGKRFSFGLELSLNEGTLEPRDDTGALIEAMIPHVRMCVARKQHCDVLDVGTGSGLIALALLSGSKNVTVTGVDISAVALEAAVANAQLNGFSPQQFRPLLSDGFASVEGRFDCIVSNPPYIRRAIIQTLSQEVQTYDPHIALDGGVDGLAFYRILACESGRYLSEGGVLGVEIGFDQKQAVIELFQAKGWAFVSAYKDLGRNDRALVFNL